SSTVAPTASHTASAPAASAPAASAPVHASRSDPVIAAAGDIACAPDSRITADQCHEAATALLVGRLHPAAVLAVGDDQYETGSLGAFESSYASSWGRFDAIVRPVPGNHEYGSSGAR